MASKSVKCCVSVWENNDALFEGLLIIKEKELERSANTQRLLTLESHSLLNGFIVVGSCFQQKKCCLVDDPEVPLSDCCVIIVHSQNPEFWISAVIESSALSVNRRPQRRATLNTGLCLTFPRLCSNSGCLFLTLKTPRLPKHLSAA